MIPYGSVKRRGKSHPHNICEVCSEKTINKKRDRCIAKREMHEYKSRLR